MISRRAVPKLLFDLPRRMLPGRVIAAVALVGVLIASPTLAPAGAEAASIFPPGNCPNPAQQTGPKLPHGALAMYCVPPSWNGDLIVWAHGYVDVTQKIGFYHLNFPDGAGGSAYLPDVAEALGFAFATTSYRANGLVILEGTQDIEELVDNFTRATGKPRPTHVYQIGASEGGAISTLLAERSPQRFSGALAMCGPIGSFRGQINYIGDTRVLFDYLYPGVLPGQATQIPTNLITNWTSTFAPAVKQAIAANPDGVRRIYRMLGAPVNPAPDQLDSTALDVLWYNVFGTNDATLKLDGNPYDNIHSLYLDSQNLIAVNVGVQRFRADPEALANLKPYETSGQVTIPLVTLHTTGDDIIPFWHEVLYFFKSRGSASKVTQIPVDAYGHCHFTLTQVLGAFALLVLQVGAQPVPGIQPANVEQAHGAFSRQLVEQNARARVP